MVAGQVGVGDHTGEIATACQWVDVPVLPRLLYRAHAELTDGDRVQLLLGSEMLVARDFERLDEMRLEPVRTPNPLNAAVRCKIYAKIDSLFQRIPKAAETKAFEIFHIGSGKIGDALSS